MITFFMYPSNEPIPDELIGLIENMDSYYAIFPYIFIFSFVVFIVLILITLFRG